jgi:hypothetical protein
MQNILTQALASGNQLSIDSTAISGGTLYVTTVASANGTESPATVFVPLSATSPQRFLKLTDAKSDAGIALAATASAGAVGVARTAGTSLQLVGEATSASAVTDKAIFEFNLPDTYAAGANIPVTINAVVTGSGTMTAASTTMTVAAYTETNGVEAALTVSAAVQIPKTTAANLAFTITGTNLVAGQHLVVELSMLVTTSAGACTGYINSASLQA